jgi:putative ABC transport system permease protein
VTHLPGVATENGEPSVAFDSIVIIEARTRGSDRRVFFPLLGTTRLRPEARLTEGRLFKPGLHELIATNACARQFKGFELGARREVRGIDWTVVGHFNSGESLQCLVTTDTETLMTAFGRNTYTDVNVRLRAQGDFEVFRKAIEANPALHLEAQRERDVMEDSFKRFNALLNFAAYFVGAIMALGATLGAVNSLYSIVDARRRELATLRAIGFGSGAIVASTLAESMLLAVPGALLGAGLAWLFFHGMAVSPFGYSFQLEVTPQLAVVGVTWALAMGLVGGLLPALRAARVPVTTALRAS